MSDAALPRDPAAGQRFPAGDWLLLAGALLLSAALLWYVVRQPVVASGYLAGAAVLALALQLALRRRHGPAAGEPAEPDWSVTYAALDRADAALAVTDRGGRTVCANPLFEAWFGTGAAPPNLALEGSSPAELEELARSAWRDGAASNAGQGDPRQPWLIAVRRCGRGDDYLVWTIARGAEADLTAAAARALGGRPGRLLDHAGLQAAVVSPDGVVLAASAGFARRATGDPAGEVAGGEFAACFREDEHGRIYYAREGRKGPPLRVLHLPLVDRDGSASFDPAEAASLILLVEAGAGTGAGQTPAGVAQIEALLARLPLGLAMTDGEGRFLFANDAFLRTAGHDDRLAPPYPADLVVREDKGALVEAVRRHAKGSPTSGEVAVRLRSAPAEPVTVSLASVRGLGEAAALLSVKDSTEEIRLKRQIAQATKMQAVGQLAGGVAHDFNNVLTAIIGHCDLMLLRHMPGDSDYDDIQQIKANSNRAASLTRQLLAFSRQQTLRPQVLQLPDVVSEVSHMLKRLLGERIELEVNHARDLGPVWADPGQLEQVIVNLVVNARDAMLGDGEQGDGGGGKLMVRTHPVSAAEVRAMTTDIMPIGAYTALVVEDTGGGIPPDIIGKIFEPFFTTKETGKGTGLGLSTVYGVVKQSGGFIFADSEPGKGTRFTIYLPVHHPDDGEEPFVTPAERETKPAAAAWSPGGRILLVEDEDTVRAVAERALTRAGYRVTAARDGDDGLAAVVGGDGFDLVVSDVVMPGMDGPAMARAIREHRPTLPILFMSGYAEEQLRREIDLPDVHFLAKPFSVRQIGEAVAHALRS